MKQQKKNWNWLLLWVYLMAILFVIGLLFTYAETEALKTYLTPSLQDASGWDIYMLQGGLKKHISLQELCQNQGETVYLSRILTKEQEQAGYTILELDGSGWQQSVFLNGKLLYTVNPELDNRIGHVTFSSQYQPLAGAGEYVRFTLPAGYANKVLTIATAFFGDVVSQKMPVIRLSSEGINTKAMVSQTNKFAMPATAYLVIGLLLLGLFIYIAVIDTHKFSLLILASAAFIQAFQLLSNYQFNLPTQFRFYIPAGNALSPVFLCLTMLYLLTQMRRWRGWCLPFIVGPTLLYSIMYCFRYLGVLSAGQLLLWQQTIYLSIVALFVFSVLEMKDRNSAFLMFCPALFTALIGIGCFTCCLLLQGRTAEESFLLHVISETFTGNPSLPQYCMGMLLFVLGTGVSFVLVIQKTVETQTQLRHSADLLSTQVSALIGRADAVQAMEEKLRIQRHDMRHQLQVAEALVKKGNQDAALEYIQASQESFNTVQLTHWCRNPVLDAILSSYFVQAEAAGIQIETWLDIPDVLPVDAVELATVFANVLENAIHACAKMPEGQRKIVCKCVGYPQLMFEVLNPYIGEIKTSKNGYPTSSEQNHGVGMRSIAAFVHKHDAFFMYETENGWFRLRISL